MSDQRATAIHFGEVYTHKNSNDQSGDEGSPTLWPVRDNTTKRPTKAEIRKRGIEDLYSLYENMGSAADLTFKDMCGYLPQKKEEKVKTVDSEAATVDFTEGLAAVQSALSTQVLSEPVQDSQKSESMQEQELPRTTPSKSGNERVHPREHLVKNDSMGVMNGLKKNASESYRRSISSESGATFGAAGNGVILKEYIAKQKSNKRNGNNKQASDGGGAPHSKYCCICNRYALFLKTRCLVCGRCYCTNCVKLGMGNMPEGRKCRSCLGRRFSERYIDRAGKAWFNLSREARMAEIKWAKKGPHRRDASVSRSARMPHNFAHQRTPQRSPLRTPQRSTPQRSPQFTPPRSPLRAYPLHNAEFGFL